MGNFSKNKLLLCFRPVDHMDAMFESKVAAAAAYRSKNKPKFSESWIMQKPPKRTISKVFKDIVFETILNRRSHHKNRYGYDCSGGSKHKFSTYKETKVLQSSIPKQKVLSSQSKSLSTKEKEKEDSHERLQGKQKKFEFYALCLFLISLAFTVFCGRIFGIMLTSIWVYFFSLWDSSYCCQKMTLSARVQCKDKVTIWKK